MLEAALPPKKKKGLGERIFFGIVGPNELDVVQPYRPYYPRFNLFPAKALPPFWTVAVGAAVGGGLLVGGLVLFFNSLIDDSANKAAELERELAFQKNMHALVEKADLQKNEAAAQLQLFKSVDDRLFRWSNALDIFRCLTPADTRLTSLKGDSAGQILAEGQSRDLTSIGYLMLNLRASGLFYKPKLFTSELSDVGGQKLFQFTLSTELLNPASVSLPVGGPP